MSDDELSEQSLEERSGGNIPILTDRSLCSRVQKIVNVDGTKRITTWHCENCNSTFLKKRDERKHAYRTNVWLRKKVADPKQVADQAKGSKKRKAADVDPEGESAVEAEGGGAKKKGRRGRRGGVMHPKLGPCRDWAKGTCLKGVSCKFTHQNSDRGGAEEAESSGRPGGHENGGGVEGQMAVELPRKKSKKSKKSERSEEKRGSIVDDPIRGHDGPSTSVHEGEQMGKTKKKKVNSASLSLRREEEINTNLHGGALENPILGENNSSPPHTGNGKKSKLKKLKVVDEKPLILLWGMGAHALQQERERRSV